jgi:hypothetical protein
MEPYGSYFDHTRNNKTVSGSTKRIRAYVYCTRGYTVTLMSYVLLSKDMGLLT